MVNLARLSIIALLAAVTGSSRHGVPKKYFEIRPYVELVGYPQKNATTTEERLFMTFKPSLKVYDGGCFPYPAVDPRGYISGGIWQGASGTLNCSNSPGQIYARAAWSDFKVAIMYAWYFPRNNAATGRSHAHDWQHVIVWVTSRHDAYFKGMAIPIQGNRKYKTIRLYDAGMKLVQDRPVIGYRKTSRKNTTLFLTEEPGTEQPLVPFSAIDSATREGLHKMDFGKAAVPFIQPEFMKNIRHAKLYNI